jgi:hypothetical protein
MAPKQNRIQGMPSKQDLSKKNKKQIVDQCVWNKEKIEKIIIKFCFFSGNGFEMEIDRLTNISSIISKIDEMIKLILNIDQNNGIVYELIYKNERIDVFQEIGIYYEDKFPIFINMKSDDFRYLGLLPLPYDNSSPFYHIGDMYHIFYYDMKPIFRYTDPFITNENKFKHLRDIMFNSNIALYDIDEDFSNVFGIPELIPLDESEKIYYGCRCKYSDYMSKYMSKIDKCKHNYMSKYMPKIECEHDYIFRLLVKQTSCCNIFTLKLQELCKECCRSLFNLFYKIYIEYVDYDVLHYHEEQYHDLILRNNLGNALFLRFKDVLHKFFTEIRILRY